MNKTQAINQLKRIYKRYPKCYGDWDKLPQSSKDEDWDSFKDHLLREGHITTHQYETWGEL